MKVVGYDPEGNPIMFCPSTSALAVTDATLTSTTSVASVSGSAGSTTAEPPYGVAHVDDRVHHLAGGTRGESADHSKKTG